MAFEQPISGADLGVLLSTNDLSAKQFYVVKIDTAHDDQVVLCNTAGEAAFGILQNTPTAGTVAQVRPDGVSKGVYGGTVTRGDKLTVNASGQLVTAHGSDRVIALAIESGSSSDIHAVKLVVGAPFADHAPMYLEFVIDLASITGNNEVVADFTPGFAGRISAEDFIVDVPVTTGGKLATLTCAISETAPTGAGVALTSALATPMGAKIQGGTITALNTFGATDTISVDASGVTAFSEGKGTYRLLLK